MVRITSGLAACAMLAAATSIGAQQAPSSSVKGASNLLTLSGCVGTDPRQNNVFTLSDATDPTVYRLTGTNVRKYIGQRVEVSGTAPKRLKIVGGLYPSPNVAGQAGAIDPAKAAVAAQTEPNPANVSAMTEIRVKSVRAVPGPCPDK